MKRIIRNNINFPYTLHDMTKYSGYLLSNRQHYECVVEIYHEGDMVFVVEE